MSPRIALCLLLGVTVALGAGCGPRPVPPADAGVEDAGWEQPDASEPDGGELPDGGQDPGSTDGGWPAPETVLLSGPSGIVATSSATFTFSTNDARHTFECSLDNVAFTACSSPQQYAAVGEGYHWFRVRAVAPDGVPDPTPAARGWTVDTVAPDTALVRAPVDEGSSVTASFVFAVAGAAEPGATFECALDGAAFTACASPRHYSALSPGLHTFEVRAVDAAGNLDLTPASHAWTVATPSPTTVRVMAANLTSGTAQSYAAGHGTRIFQGLVPDIVLIQEFNYGTNTAAELRAFVDAAFGPEFYFTRQAGVQIPNGVISRFPIVASGTWDDPQAANRDFTWARIDVPGPIDLWAVSLHLLTTSAGARSSEASVLVAEIAANVPEEDFLVLGGDLNTDVRGEACIGVLAQVVITSDAVSPWPVDQDGNGFTNGSRTKPYDWLLADPDLAPRETPLVIGGSAYANGLVFDSRVYTPLSEVTPVLEDDSAAQGMQHMAVLKDFVFPP